MLSISESMKNVHNLQWLSDYEIVKENKNFKFTREMLGVCDATASDFTNG